MPNKIARLIPEDNGNWNKFTVVIERSKQDGNFKLSINGEDSLGGRTFRMGLDDKTAIQELSILLTRL